MYGKMKTLIKSDNYRFQYKTYIVGDQRKTSGVVF